MLEDMVETITFKLVATLEELKQIKKFLAKSFIPKFGVLASEPNIVSQKAETAIMTVTCPKKWLNHLLADLHGSNGANFDLIIKENKVSKDCTNRE
ncbi:MAG: hypothetical protein US50_C0021G0012 [Candidatus Nomurabacteria bacterium GW2011_GWB1_37_5]|uniref:Uncharacterized protein n=1 Tax=Candidatus Nomurabacteria bacterium GW2011_GWB1_37_5 TaxID=1618742 RepID=A0A0G0GW55_9BACT|nr:MAG: hypothetical protein US50_C0021G0012 [Candidatus Nomurabacteria bacterium GW2011_GWB1_37_5]